MQSALNNYWLFKVLLLDTGYLWDVFVDVRALFLWRLFSGNSISIKKPWKSSYIQAIFYTGKKGLSHKHSLHCAKMSCQMQSCKKIIGSS